MRKTIYWFQAFEGFYIFSSFEDFSRDIFFAEYTTESGARRKYYQEKGFSEKIDFVFKGNRIIV